MIKLILHGYLGKMGQVIASLCKARTDMEIVAGVDCVFGERMQDFPVFNNLSHCDVKADVIIDFSTSKAIPNLIDYAIQNKIALVLCTTGLSEDVIAKISDASKHIPVFKSANMSLGINLIASVLSKVSKILYDESFDIEIIEKHHNQKIDAPSGTALLLANKINESVDGVLDYKYDRHSFDEKRTKNELGICAVRGGTIVGEHEVIFAGKDEVIEFKHSAYSKEIFAVGAIKAAKFVYDKPIGMYNMDDLIISETSDI